MKEESRELYMYRYSCDTDVTVIIGNQTDIFDGEGIQQRVEIHVEHNLTYSTNFGREHVLDMFLNKQDHINFDIPMITFEENKLTMSNGIIDEIIFLDGEYETFMDWMVDVLTPLSTKRKVKIDKLKSKIKDKYVL